MAGKSWTDEEVKALRKVMDATPGVTISTRVKRIAPWNGRTIPALEEKLRAIGYQIDYRKTPTATADLEDYITEVGKLRDELDRAERFEESLIETVGGSLALLPRLKVPDYSSRWAPPGKKKTATHAAMAVIGDCQVGECFTAADASAMAHGYSFDSFVERSHILVDKIKELTYLHRHYDRVDDLYIMMLGDIVEGEEIYKKQRNYIDRRIIPQMYEGAEVLSRAICDLAGYFKNVEIRCVWGNHGKIGPYYADDQNFDAIAYMFMRQRLESVKNIKFYLSESYNMACRLRACPDYTWVVWHGENVKRYMTLPYYNFEKTAASYVQLANIPIHYFLIGHHHRHAEIDTPHGKLMINGNWVGASPLAVNVLKTGSIPSQMFFILHEKLGIVATYDIRLAKPVALTADDNGFFTPVK